jgi:hypothetical protein
MENMLIPILTCGLYSLFFIRKRLVRLILKEIPAYNYKKGQSLKRDRSAIKC